MLTYNIIKKKNIIKGIILKEIKNFHRKVRVKNTANCFTKQNSYIKNSFLDLIGNTPIVQIDNILSIPFYMKLESYNIGGSIKDRAALYMIENAEKNNMLHPGGTIVEASSGNQGIAAAMIGNIKGYKTIVTMSEKVSQEKKNIFQAYGAEIVLCKPNSNFNDPEHYYQVAKKIAENTPNSYFLNQYFNPKNQEAHYYGVGREIDQQIGNSLTYIFVSLGSGGTGSGIAKYMQEHRPNIKVIAVDSINSYLATEGNPKPYYLDGMGIDYKTPFYDKSLFYDTVFIEDQEAHHVLKEMVKKHGMLIGPSSGGAIAGMLRYKNEFTENDKILTLLCDSGKNYLSKKFYG